MRTLVILRGLPGSGKSYFCRKHKWEEYTLCPDTFRLMLSSPNLDIEGNFAISQKVSAAAFSMLYTVLEKRMQNGDFTVIDATSIKRKDLNKYKELATQYKYRVYCIDFTKMPIKTVKNGNNLRKGTSRYVPEFVIDRMYKDSQIETVPSGITVLYTNEYGEISEEEIREKIYFNKINLNEYKAIHVFGDIHGCYSCLRKYLDEINPEDFYIFTGDYIDRGLENVEVLKFLMPLAELPNVLFLEGNHEKWLSKYAYNLPAHSDEFEKNTRPQLMAAGISQREVKSFYRKLGQVAYFDYHGKTFTVCHGGINRLPNTKISTFDYIHGVGKYEDSIEIANVFFDNTPDNNYLIHGHRNIYNSPIQVNDRCYNLENQVEMGGFLRVLKITPNNIETFEIQNDVFSDFDYGELTNRSIPETVERAVEVLRNSKWIKERKEDNISSFNFTRQAFCNRKWTDATIKARGLFINTSTNKIVARGYEKFFSVEENHLVTLDALQKKFSYPLKVYIKENGFLGLLGYDEETDDFVIASKSTTAGDYAGYFKKLLFEKINGKEDELKNYLRNNNACMTFEVVDIENDPHIIEYDESKIVLLDVLDRELKFSRLDYEKLIKVGEWLNIEVKEKAAEFNNWDEFYSWYNKVIEEGYLYNGKSHIEGFVIEDQNLFMTKIKLHYYKQWKKYRSLADAMLNRGFIRYNSLITSPLDKAFYAFCKKKYRNRDKNISIGDNEKELKKNGKEVSIIALRKEFFEEHPKWKNDKTKY